MKTRARISGGAVLFGLLLCGWSCGRGPAAIEGLASADEAALAAVSHALATETLAPEELLDGVQGELRWDPPEVPREGDTQDWADYDCTGVHGATATPCAPHGGGPIHFRAFTAAYRYCEPKPDSTCPVTYRHVGRRIFYRDPDCTQIQAHKEIFRYVCDATPGAFPPVPDAGDEATIEDHECDGGVAAQATACAPVPGGGGVHYRNFRRAYRLCVPKTGTSCPATYRHVARTIFYGDAACTRITGHEDYYSWACP